MRCWLAKPVTAVVLYPNQSWHPFLSQEEEIEGRRHLPVIGSDLCSVDQKFVTSPTTSASSLGSKIQHALEQTLFFSSGRIGETIKVLNIELASTGASIRR